MTNTILWKYHDDITLPENNSIEVITEECVNLIALGRTGDGKSSLLNDLLGKQVFKQKVSAKSQTKQVEDSVGFWAPLKPYMHGKDQFGCHIRVFDTPGFGDSQFQDETFFPVIQKTINHITAYRGGIHCILLVFKITANSDTIIKSMDALHRLMDYRNDFWDNVLLVFTHVDIVNGDTGRYQSHKLSLRTAIAKQLKERYHLVHDLPMLWISTQKYSCSYIKGLGDCDCERGARYHADCRRRLYEQVMKRRHCPFKLNIEEEEE